MVILDHVDEMLRKFDLRVRRRVGNQGENAVRFRIGINVGQEDVVQPFLESKDVI